MKLPVLFVAVLGFFLQGADPLVLFLSQQEPLECYRATRRMEGSAPRLSGWLVVEAVFENGKIQLEIKNEGGSEGMRNKVLKPLLEEESNTPTGSSDNC